MMRRCGRLARGRGRGRRCRREDLLLHGNDLVDEVAVVWVLAGEDGHGVGVGREGGLV